MGAICARMHEEVNGDAHGDVDGNEHAHGDVDGDGHQGGDGDEDGQHNDCLLYTSPSPRD
eukprot:10792459-Alexandrium_andersonii.AAC.1